LLESLVLLLGLRDLVWRRLSGIGGLDYWTGLLDWNTGMAWTAVKSLFLDMATF